MCCWNSARLMQSMLPAALPRPLLLLRLLLLLLLRQPGIWKIPATAICWRRPLPFASWSRRRRRRETTKKKKKKNTSRQTPRSSSSFSLSLSLSLSFPFFSLFLSLPHRLVNVCTTSPTKKKLCAKRRRKINQRKKMEKNCLEGKRRGGRERRGEGNGEKAAEQEKRGDKIREDNVFRE
jgi:hypothetical protein